MLFSHLFSLYFLPVYCSVYLSIKTVKFILSGDILSLLLLTLTSYTLSPHKESTFMFLHLKATSFYSTYLHILDMLLQRKTHSTFAPLITTWFNCGLGFYTDVYHQVINDDQSTLMPKMMLNECNMSEAK